MDFHDLARGFVVKEVRIEQPRAKAAPRRKEVADLLAMGEDMFRPAEWEFLQSLNQWRGEFTPKQQGWLDDIKARARRAA
jgi:hypothetical protein